MNLINQIERKFGHLAIRRLMYYIILANAAVWLLGNINPTLIKQLQLVPELVLRGQIWRLISFITIPPTFNPLWGIITLYLYYLIGTNLENEWGTVKFNLYYFTGMFATIVAVFITGGSATSYYLNLSLFLAFARINPHFELLIFFILPVKIKYIAWFIWLIFGYNILSSPFNETIAIIVALINYFLFFGKDTIDLIKLKRQVHFNRKRFFDEIASTPPIHRCAVCEITERDDRRMDFSYCKECSDDYQYCSKHINEHQHQKQNH
ncbi:MAG: hypothetical protein GXY86_05290 [Firmicutes bacterium]|nr:hypothetical protein [Bacillota bacterium]